MFVCVFVCVSALCDSIECTSHALSDTPTHYLSLIRLFLLLQQTVMESIYRGIGHTFGSLLGGIAVSRLGSIASAFWLAGWVQLMIALVSTAFL